VHLRLLLFFRIVVFAENLEIYNELYPQQVVNSSVKFLSEKPGLFFCYNLFLSELSTRYLIFVPTFRFVLFKMGLQLG
jgi:hypothetical protein